VATSLDIELWRFASPDARSPERALQWLLPYYTGEQRWPHRQIRPFDFTNAALVLQLAFELTHDPALARARKKVERQPWQRLVFSKASLAARQAPAGAPRK
jgi:hypothetical protein